MKKEVAKMKTYLFKDWAYSWLEYQRQFVKESTYGTYSTIVINRLIPAFGNVGLDEIGEQVIQNYILYLLKDGRLDGEGGLSAKTVRDILNVLRECLSRAQKEELIKNAKFDINFPTTKVKKNIRIFNCREQNKIIEQTYYQLNNKSIGILLCMQTGLRIGELCALKWGDIDLNENILYVNRTLQRIYVKKQKEESYSYISIDTPKSLASIRSIPLTKTLQRLLNTLYKKTVPNSQYFFLTGNYKYIEPRGYIAYYKRFLKKTDINYSNFHSLRHTFATCLIERGADCKTVSALLGHASVITTMNLYMHPQMEVKRKCVELLENR